MAIKIKSLNKSILEPNKIPIQIDTWSLQGVFLPLKDSFWMHNGYYIELKQSLCPITDNIINHIFSRRNENNRK